jgi:hypothetical protein
MPLLVKWSLLPLGVVCAVIGAMSLHAGAANRPFWTEQAMFRFGDDLFFAGQATCVASAEEGRQRAYNAAIQELLNYTRTQEIAGIPIETQMIFEEDGSENCRDKQVSVWRLLRAPAARLDKLNRMAAQQATSPDHSTGRAAVSKQVRDLTPKIGMYKDDAFEVFGQPRAVSMLRRGGGEASWDYPRFGLTLVFDLNGYLISWKHVGPGSTQQGGASSLEKQPEYAGLEGSIGPAKKKKDEDEAMDLSKRLEKMQLESSDQKEGTDAIRYCERVYPRDMKLQNSCIQYETEKRRRLSSGVGDVAMDADRSAKVLCASRWPNDLTLRDSCQKFERERILKAQSSRY